MNRSERDNLISPETEQFIGPHLFGTLHECSWDKLADENLVRDILETLPEQIGMEKIAPPRVVRYVGSKPLDWGVSGYVQAKAHVALHTYPERGFVWFDILSFSSFNVEQAKQRLRETFEAKSEEVGLIHRGSQFNPPSL